MQTEFYKHLLNSISRINKQYEKIAKITGENFNVFRILKMDRKEVRMHSALIADLLNPSGSHGCGDIFLRIFIEQQKRRNSEEYATFIKKLETFVVEDSIASAELGIGLKNEEETEGGRIDIIIKDNYQHSIIIENKIDARDQSKQLLRYNNYDKNAPIFYLTLDGHKPESDSVGDLKEKEDYVCISYKDDILIWLEQCKGKAVNFPILRESITQYIYLIKFLTNQTISEEMKNEIVDLLVSNGDNIAASIEIAKNVDAAKNTLFLNFANELKRKVESLYTNVYIEIWQPDDVGINFKNNATAKEYILLSYFPNWTGFYFEVANTENVPIEGNKRRKDPLNVEFYKEKLKDKNRWGKIENVEIEWHGDWVCRYNKLDNFFKESKNWADLADGNAGVFITEVANDIVDLLNVINEKGQSNN